MYKRKLTQAPKYQNRSIATDSHTACDTEVLASIDTMLTTALQKAENPRLMVYDIQLPGTQNINELFRDAQADFCKQQLRHDKAKMRYVGFRNPDAPSTVRIAAVYDNAQICDDSILRNVELTIKRKINDELCPVTIEANEEASIMLAPSSLDQCFYQASKIAQVAVTPAADRQRVLFSSKG